MRSIVPLLVLAVGVVGCSPTPPAPARVRGQVLVNGQPLSRGTIVLIPDSTRGTRGELAMASLDADGRFDFPGSPGAKIAPGWHRITIAPPSGAGDFADRMDKYRYPDLSGLSKEVKAGEENIFEIRIELP